MQQYSTTPYPSPAARPGSWRWLGLGCGGMLALLLCSCLALAAGAGARANPGGTATTRGGSSTIATRHWRIEVNSAVRQSALYWNNHGGRQDAVGEWLTVAVTLTNVGGENFGVNTWDFAVRDGAGKVYKHSNEWVALTHPGRIGYYSASNRQVPPGLAVSLLLVFDVNPDATGLELVFNQERHPRVALPE